MIIYASFPVINNVPTQWAQQLLTHNEKDIVYSPSLTMEANDEVNKGALLPAIDTEIDLDAYTKMKWDVLKLDLSLANKWSLLPAQNHEMASSMIFRHLYVMLRADLVIIDGNMYSLGDHGQEALWSYLIGKKTVVVNDRVFPGIWLSQTSTLTVNSSKILSILG